MAAAINNAASISGVTAAKTASGVNSVTITADVDQREMLSVTNSGDRNYVVNHGWMHRLTASVGISGTDVGNGGTATTATPALRAMHILFRSCW